MPKINTKTGKTHALTLGALMHSKIANQHSACLQEKTTESNCVVFGNEKQVNGWPPKPAFLDSQEACWCPHLSRLPGAARASWRWRLMGPAALTHAWCTGKKQFINPHIAPKSQNNESNAVKFSGVS
mmetsp:Transcript_9440/g.24053  ORF Transcript_9440/g.24053 Transcript_9440/m.24053 type:complete len:127 (-) Transcript_9440:3941-4321(-)